MKNLKTILILASLAAPAFAAKVQLSNLLPAGTTPTQVKTDASGNAYVIGNYGGGLLGSFLAKISPDGAKLIYFSEFPSLTCFNGCTIGPLAIEPNGSGYVVFSLHPPAPSLGDSSSISQIDSTTGSLQSVGSYPFVVISDMATDAQGSVYVTGNDPQGDLGYTAGSLSGANGSDNFIMKLTGQGQVVYAIRNYGGSHIAVDNKGDVFTVAADDSGTTPTPGAYQTSIPPETCNVVSMNGPACTNSQYVTGINSSGTALLFSTYLTSGGGEAPAGIAVDAAGNVYVAGTTGSANYPTTADALEPEFQAEEQSTGYVSVLNPTGTALVFSTYFGGSDSDSISTISLDEAHNLIYLGGYAASSDLPGVFGISRNCVPGSFLSALTMGGSAVTRTEPLGGYNPSVAIGADSTVWVADGYLAQVNLDALDTPIACLADSAGAFVTSTVTPGQLLTVYGNGLSADTSTLQPSNGFYPTSGTSASVTVNGIPAPILYESPHQLNVQVPFEVAGQATATIQIANVDSRTVPVTASGASIFEVDAESVGCTPAYLGQTVTLALNQDGTVNGCANPAKAGSTITIFADGFGVTSPAQATGAVVTSPTPLTLTFSPPPPTFISAEALVGSITGVYGLQIQLPDPGTYQLSGVQGSIQVQVVQ
jgi:uncharacterized protein (TIGR03437 family)